MSSVEDVRAAEIDRLSDAEMLFKLDTAICKLTQRHTTDIRQRVLGGGWRLVTVHHDPLIAMLLAATTASSTGGSGSAASASGTVLNTVAMQKLGDINAAIINSWRDLIRGSDQLVQSWRFSARESLHLWHQTFITRYGLHLVNSRTLAAEAARYDGWVDLIELMFDPVSVSEFVGECPNCDARWIVTDEDRLTAVIITFSRAVATCRQCGETWQGYDGLQKLMDAANQKLTQKRHADK